MAHPTGESESDVVRLEVLWSVEEREYLRQESSGECRLEM